MKKIVASIIISLIVLFQGITVLATSFGTLGMEVKLPDNYYDLKAGIDKNDTMVPYYEVMLKTSKEELTQTYSSGNILYNGIGPQVGKQQLNISAEETNFTKKIFHLHLASEEQLESIKSELVKMAQNQGMQILNQEIYRNNNLVFIYSQIKGTDVNIYQYYTIVNGNGITFSLYSEDSKDVQTLKDVVKTIEFTELKEKPIELEIYIMFGCSGVLVIMVFVLMILAFKGKRKSSDEE